MNKGGKRGANYTDKGTMHHAPPAAMPGEGGWMDKHEATRHSRRGSDHRFK